MKVYINKGHRMNAAIVFHPYDVEARKDPETMPESIRDWNITINGDADEKITLAGTLEELGEVIQGLCRMYESAVMQEKEGSE